MNGVKKINLKKVESVEWTFESEDGSDEVVASITYTDDFDGWHPRAPLFKSKHPDFPGMGLLKISANRIEGDQVTVKLDYKATSPTAEYPGREDKPQVQESRRYSIEAPTAEEPLLTFELFKNIEDEKKRAIQQLMASEKLKKDYDEAEKANEGDEAGLLAISKVRKGYEAYLNPGIVWVERYRTKDLTTLQLDKVGNIFPAVPGSPPNIGTRTWLYIGLTGNQSDENDGEYWDIERRWQASERGGWDTDFYGEPAPEA